MKLFLIAKILGQLTYDLYLDCPWPVQVCKFNVYVLESTFFRARKSSVCERRIQRFSSNQSNCTMDHHIIL